MSGFDAIPHQWWPGIAAGLPKPWPKEARMMDLRWHDAEERIYGRAFPTYEDLMERWGDTFKSVRHRVARVEEWEDPRHPRPRRPAAPKKVGESAHGHPRGSGGAPEGHPTGTCDTDERHEATDEGQAKGSRGAGEGHPRGHTRGEEGSTLTHHPHPHTPEAPSAPAPAPAGPSCVSPESDPTPTMETTDGRDDREPAGEPEASPVREGGDGGRGGDERRDAPATGAGEACGGGGDEVPGATRGDGPAVNPAACPHPAYDEDTGACVQCGAALDDVRHHADIDRAIGEHLQGPLFADAAPAAPKATLPEWVPPAARCHGHAREDVMVMVVRACEALLGRPANPTACGTNARSVLALWRTLGHPAPASLAADLVLVIGWAQRSPDKLAENDVRGVRPNGERWGPDRSRSMATLCVQDRWDARLDAARQWDEHGAPEAAGTAPTVPGRPDADAAWATFEAVAGSVRRGDPLPEGDTDHEREVLAVYRGSVGWRRWFERSQFTKPAIRLAFAAAWATAPAPPNPNRQEGRT